MTDSTDTPELPALAPSAPPADPLPGPTFVFFGVVAAIALLADALSKAWAEVALMQVPSVETGIVLAKDSLSLLLAYNRGGAWGMLSETTEVVRRPFFLVVSVAAVAFIVSLYSRLTEEQRALKWGLPLVLGGALGNLCDRVVRGSVVDFIDYRAGWVEAMNRSIAKLVHGWHVTDHWPTFNVADICICIGVGLMALDMLLAGRPSRRFAEGPAGSSSSADAEARGGADDGAAAGSGYADATPASLAGDDPTTGTSPDPRGAQGPSAEPALGTSALLAEAAHDRQG